MVVRRTLGDREAVGHMSIAQPLRNVNFGELVRRKRVDELEYKSCIGS